MDKFSMKLDGTTVVGSYDGNSDGQASVALKLDLKEVYGELLDKGEANVSGVVSVVREGGKLVVSIDSDKDGEAMLKLELDLIEGLEEAV